MLVRVVPGTGANNLRAEAGLDAEVIGQLEEGDEVLVTGYLTCRDGYVWVPVTIDGEVVWTAEGEGETYWLESVRE